MALVILKRNAPLTFAHSTKKEDPLGSMEKLFFRPGLNEFKNEQAAIFEVAKKHPDISMLIEDGTIIEVVTSKKGKNGIDKMPENLEEFDTKMAIDVVQGTVDLDILKGWREIEKRNKVTEEIKKQMKLVKEFRDRLEEASKV